MKSKKQIMKSKKQRIKEAIQLLEKITNKKIILKENNPVDPRQFKEFIIDVDLYDNNEEKGDDDCLSGEIYILYNDKIVYKKNNIECQPFSYIIYYALSEFLAEIEFPDPYKNIDHLIDQIDSELEASYKVTIDFVKKEVVNIANKI